ncbi:MAG: twin-arginine translocase TatA/TatE family subunit [Planctomycetes bacterium]|nr:twin-arginine translocase TatA/TatE family subunit [Planctomycetota bacterium]
MDVLTLGTLSAVHIIVVLVIVLLLFGASKIPELMRSLGSGLGEFKKGVKESLKDENAQPPAAKVEEKK